MTCELLAVCFEARQPQRVARFWAGVLGREVVDYAGGALLPGEGTQVGLGFVPSRTEKVGPNRIHLHLTSDSLADQQHTVEAALELGARHIDVGQRPEEGHVVPTDPDDLPAVVAVETLAVACRAQPIRLDAATHDLAVAAISHLPLVVAAALVETVAGPDAGRATPPGWPIARSLAASGWRDMTRLARGDVAMGAGIAATNAPAIAARLREFRDVVDGWLADLERSGGPDEAALARRLAAAREHLGEAGSPVRCV